MALTGHRDLLRGDAGKQRRVPAAEGALTHLLPERTDGEVEAAAAPLVLHGDSAEELDQLTDVHKAGEAPRIRSSRVLPERPDPVMYNTVGKRAVGLTASSWRAICPSPEVSSSMVTESSLSGAGRTNHDIQVLGPRAAAVQPGCAQSNRAWLSRDGLDLMGSVRVAEPHSGQAVPQDGES